MNIKLVIPSALYRGCLLFYFLSVPSVCLAYPQFFWHGFPLAQLLTYQHPLTIPAQINFPEVLTHEEQLQVLSSTAASYTGGLLMLGLYHLFLFFRIHERYLGYLYFALLTINLSLLVFCFYGAYSIPTQTSILQWPQAGIVLFVMCTILTQFKFVQTQFPNILFPSFLQKNFIEVYTIVFIFNTIAFLINNYYGSLLAISILWGFSFFLLTKTGKIYQSKVQRVIYYIAFLSLLLGLSVLAGVYLQWISLSLFLLHSLYLAVVLYIMILSLILADRINLLTEKQAAITKEIQQAEQSQRFKDQFLANTSHEIRTPMNAVLGFTRLLEQSRLDPTQQQYVGLIKDSAENLLVIINDILDFSKIESGKIVFEQVDIHLNTLCYSLIETLRFKIAEKNLEVGYFIDNRIPEVFLGDPVRLNQILLNLLSNAIKFTEQGSVFLKAQLLEETAEQIKIHFEVKDTGIGVPEDKLHVIFDSFSQASEQTTRKYGGTGLGLTIVKQLVELQGGHVHVESRLQEGSTFIVHLPFRKGSTIAHVKARNVSLSNPVPNNLSILLLEDNPINQILAVNTLQKWMPDIRIDVAADGKEGILKLSKKDYDLMLVDIQMPQMDGYETTRYIRTQMPYTKKNIPIIALTAGALKEDESKALEAGMNDYVSKPFDIETLAGKINRLQTWGDRITTKGNKFEIGHVERAGLGDPQFMVQLMNMFLEKTPEAIVHMEQFAEARNWKGISFIAHRIKSVFVCMGLTHLQIELLAIEESAQNLTQLSAIPRMIANLKKGCEETYSQIIEERDKLINKN